MERFLEGYRADLERALRRLDPAPMRAMAEAMIAARAAGRQVFLLGNGGSAATPSHSAGDWAKELGLRTRCLSDNVALLTALANDVAYDAVFVEQLEVYLEPGDVVIAYSGSGNSANVLRAVEYAKAHGLYISANAEDASRADKDFIITFAKAAKEAGADRFRYCDTLGILEPRRTYDEIKRIIEEAKIDVEMHTHNDFGMATANALAGVQAGAKVVSTTVLGIGERTGNTPMEEIAMCGKHILKMDTNFDTSRFREVSEYVARAAGRDIPAWKPIVGANCFAHEAGIHTDGVIKYFSNYEPYTPEEVGLTRKIIIGKHSGRHTLKQVLSKRGYEIDDEVAGILLEHVRANSVALKRSLTENELVYIYLDHRNGVPGKNTE